MTAVLLAGIFNLSMRLTLVQRFSDKAYRSQHW
jgi:hypothetical protein